MAKSISNSTAIAANRIASQERMQQQKIAEDRMSQYHQRQEKEEERRLIRVEQNKQLEEQREAKNDEIEAQLEQARMEAQQQTYITNLNHSHRMVEKTQDFQNEITLRSGQHSFELAKDRQAQNAQKNRELTVQRDRQNHEIKLHQEKHKSELELEALKKEFMVRQEVEGRETYAHNSYVDTAEYGNKSKIDTLAHKERTKIDMEKMGTESLHYAFRKIVDAKLEVFVYDEKAKIDEKRRIPKEEQLDEHYRYQKKKWDSEL